MLRAMMTIVVLGGGGFSTGDALLDDWVLGCARRAGAPPSAPWWPTGRSRPGLAVDDGCAVRLVDGEVVDAVASVPGVGAWRVLPQDGEAVEEPLAVGPAGPALTT